MKITQADITNCKTCGLKLVTRAYHEKQLVEKVTHYPHREVALLKKHNKLMRQTLRAISVQTDYATKGYRMVETARDILLELEKDE